MRIGLRGITHDGDDFEVVREFEYTFELFTILKPIVACANRLDVFFSPDVNAADAEFAMGLAIGGDWASGRCRGSDGALIRLTTNGGNA